MIELWHGLGPETKAALIGALTTIAVGLLGVGGLILQMRSQARQGREAIFENERRKLKASMYEEAVSVSRELSDAAIDLSTQLRTMPFYLSIASKAHSVGLGYDLPPTRYPDLTTAYDVFADAALRFIFLVENRRIVDPRILVYRTALNVVLHDTQKLMHHQFVIEVMPALPTAGPDGKLFPYTPPAETAVERIRILSEQFLASLADAIMCTEDFLVELQNHLLGDLFGKTVAHREPIDLQCKVITLDKADELEAWYKTSTEWGRNCTKVEAEVRERLKQESA